MGHAVQWGERASGFRVSISKCYRKLLRARCSDLWRCSEPFRLVFVFKEGGRRGKMGEGVHTQP